MIGLKKSSYHRCPQIPHCSSYTNRLLRSRISSAGRRNVESVSVAGSRFFLNTSSPAVISTRRGHRRSTGASRVSGDEPLVELVWSGNGIDSTRYRPQEGAEEAEQQFQQQVPPLGRISKANSYQAALKKEDVSIRRRANTSWQLGEKKKSLKTEI